MSDQGKEFVNSTLEELAKLCGVEMRFSTPHYHESMGRVERLNQTLQRSIRKMLRGSLAHWDTVLPLVQHYYNTTISSISGSSPYALMFTLTFNELQNGSSWVHDSSAFDDWVDDHKKRVLNDTYPVVRANVNKKRAEKMLESKRIVPALKVGTFVKVRDPYKRAKNDQFFVGNYVIDSITSTGAYKLRSPDGTIIEKPISHLKSIPAPAEPENEYEVERILSHRGRQGDYSYFVRWKGYSAADDSWEHESNFLDLKIISDYWKTVSRKSTSVPRKRRKQ